MHELTRLNQIVFPLGQVHRTESGALGQSPIPNQAAGRTYPKFDDLSIRIKAGRSLYALLFGMRRYTALCWPSLGPPSTKDRALNTGRPYLRRP